eukprot:11343906-Ditylum_brightwellii.AAC.1
MQDQVYWHTLLWIVPRNRFCSPYNIWASHTYYNQIVTKTWMLPQCKFCSASLQLVEQPGIEPGSLAYQGLTCLHS